MSRKIQFSVESDEQKKELDEYAKSKGYGSAAALAKVALFQYVNRYPAKPQIGSGDREKTQG